MRGQQSQPLSGLEKEDTMLLDPFFTHEDDDDHHHDGWVKIDRLRQPWVVGCALDKGQPTWPCRMMNMKP